MTWKVHSGNKVTDYNTQSEWKFNYQWHLILFLLMILLKFLLLKSLLQKYQGGLEESMTGSKFSLESVDLLQYHLQKTSLKRKQRSYIDSPKWFKNKKETINPKNDDDNCFEYASTAALSYQNIKRNTDVTNQ